MLSGAPFGKDREDDKKENPICPYCQDEIKPWHRTYKAPKGLMHLGCWKASQRARRERERETEP